MKHHFDGILRRIYKPSGQEFFIKSSYPYLSSNTDLLNSFSFFSKMMSRKIVPIHTFVNIPALIRKSSMFLSSRARTLTKVWIRDIDRFRKISSKRSKSAFLIIYVLKYVTYHRVPWYIYNGKCWAFLAIFQPKFLYYSAFQNHSAD